MAALQNLTLAFINVHKMKRTEAKQLGREKLARMGPWRTRPMRIRRSFPATGSGTWPSTGG
jgi:ABC-type polar amino acid transport system ATPase subunit